MLWWRYRDDIFDLWTQGLPKLLEFTDYINDLYPTIKSESHLNVLDLTLHFCNGFISTDVYAKLQTVLFRPSGPHQCSADVWDGG